MSDDLMPVAECAKCGTAYVLRVGLSFTTGGYRYTLQPDESAGCRPRSKCKDAGVPVARKNEDGSDVMAPLPITRESSPASSAPEGTPR